MKEIDEEKILVLGALLHDIGKLVPGFRKVTHQEAGEKFIQEVIKGFDELKERISYMVKCHHQEESNNILKIIRNSDQLSAEAEREKRENEGNRSNEPLKSVFNLLNIGKPLPTEELYYPLVPLPLDKKYSEEFLPMTKTKAIRTSRSFYYKDQPGKNLSKSYEEVWNSLRRSVGNISCDNFKDYVDTLNFILKNYLQFVPSAVYKSIPDISLYDHLKTTAAIALCLYRAKSEKKFLLIGGDISGIQNFIFSNFRYIESDKYTSKRLRGRSTFINLFLDAAITYIKEELNLYEFNILWASGGNFVILAPNTKENKEKLKKIRENINKFLFKNYRILYLNLSWIEGNEKDIKNFSEFLYRLGEKENVEKKRKWNFMLHDVFSPQDSHVKEEDICVICGLRRGRHYEEIKRVVCSICKNLEELGNEVVKAKYILKKFNEGYDYTLNFKFGDFSIYYKLTSEMPKNYDFLYSINSFRMIKEKCGFKMIGNYAPKGNGIISFDKIVDSNYKSIEKRRDQKNGGTPSKLAIFKADIDNLGLIFSLGLEKKLRSISRITQLSFLLDYFFSIKINEIAKKHNIYVLFSGGDDLTVAGRYDEIIEFAKEIQNKFERWACHNSNVTISGGIEMANYKFPISKLVNCGESSLEKSKEKGRNRITLFDVTVEWSLFNILYGLYENIKTYMKEGKITSSLLYKILKIHELTPYGKKENEEFNILAKKYVIPNPHPYIRYFFSRAWKVKTDEEKRKRDKLIETLLKDEIFQNIKIPISLSSLYNRYFLTKEVKR